jgi:hypothetical protein
VRHEVLHVGLVDRVRSGAHGTRVPGEGCAAHAPRELGGSTHGLLSRAGKVVLVREWRAGRWIRTQVDPVQGWRQSSVTRRVAASLAAPAALVLLAVPAGGVLLLVLCLVKAWLAYCAVRVVRPHQHRHWTKARTASGAALACWAVLTVAPVLVAVPTEWRAGVAGLGALALSATAWALGARVRAGRKTGRAGGGR